MCFFIELCSFDFFFFFFNGINILKKTVLQWHLTELKKKKKNFCKEVLTDILKKKLFRVALFLSFFSFYSSSSIRKL